MRIHRALSGFLGCVLALPTHGQDSILRQPPVIRPLLIGAGAAAVGYVGGFYVGAALLHGCQGEECQAVGGALVAVAAGTLGMTSGVHAGNRRLGNVGLDLLTVVGRGVALLAMQGPFDVATIPLLQLGATVLVERMVAGCKLARLTLTPLPGGRMAVGVQIPLGPLRSGASARSDR